MGFQSVLIYQLVSYFLPSSAFGSIRLMALRAVGATNIPLTFCSEITLKSNCHLYPQMLLPLKKPEQTDNDRSSTDGLIYETSIRAAMWAIYIVLSCEKNQCVGDENKSPRDQICCYCVGPIIGSCISKPQDLSTNW